MLDEEEREMPACRMRMEACKWKADRREMNTAIMV
jgi:hypothetical protein